MPAPSGQRLVLRDAQPPDADAVARVHVRAWQTAYRDLLPAPYLDWLQPEERARRYTFGREDPGTPRTLVALEGTELVGFATVMPAPAANDVGELAALHVDPQHWGRGFGRALIEAARARLLASGFRSARLWLLDGNRRAERFYRIDGWLPDGERRQETVWGVEVHELGFRRELR